LLRPSYGWFFPPQVLVESLTQWGFSPFPGEYRWTAHEKPVEVARILANTTDSAFNSLMRVIGPWEPASWRTFGLILLDERSLMGFGVISPAESAWNIAEAVTKGKPY
jgi:hypothetical protein